MTRPYSSFLKEDQSADYGTHWDKIDPKFLLNIVQLLNQYSLLDVGRAMAFSGFFSSEADLAVTTYTTLLHKSSPDAVVDAAADAYLEPERFDFYVAVRDFGKQSQHHRRTMAHALCMWSPSVGDAGVLFVWPREWIEQAGQWQAAASGKSANQAEPGKQAFDPKQIQVYSLEDFSAITAQIGRAIDAWFALNAWLWPKTCPIRIANPFERLLSEPDVLAKINRRRAARELPLLIAGSSESMLY